MPVSITWSYRHNDIIQLTFTPTWTWDAFYDAVAKTRKMATAAPYNRVDIIAEIRGKTVPFGGLLFRHLDTAVADPSPKQGRIVLVLESQVLQSIVRAAMRISPKTAGYYLIASSVEEAEAMLAHLRESSAQQAAR